MCLESQGKTQSSNLRLKERRLNPTRMKMNHRVTKTKKVKKSKMKSRRERSNSRG